MIDPLQQPNGFSAIDVLDVAGYLRNNGWLRVGDDALARSTWIRQVEDGTVEVDLPTDRSVRDYALRMMEAVRTIAVVDHRPPAQLIEDFRTASFDVLRTRLPGADGGTLPLADAATSLTGLRELVLAAASSAVDARPNYPTVKPPEAVAYLERVELAAPERGSFVFRALSPVPSHIDAGQLVPDEPFGRRALKRLVQGVSSAKRAAHAAVEVDDGAAFERAIGEGVSANLCEALVGIAAPVEKSGLELSVAWSPVRGSPEGWETFHRRPVVRLSEVELIQIGEAARVLRESGVAYEVALEGFVVRLASQSADQGGSIVVSAWFRGQQRKIQVDLGPQDYARALTAHARRDLVSFVGDVDRTGTRYRALNARRFMVHAMDDDE